MSLRNHMINSNYGVYENLDINSTLNVDGTIIYQGQPLNVNGSSGGLTNITNTDGSITVTNNNGAIVLSNAGINQHSNINLNGTNLTGVNSVQFSAGLNLYYNSGNLAYDSATNTTSVNLFDDTNNYPYIQAILAKNNNANNNSLLNLNLLSCNNKIGIGTYTLQYDNSSNLNINNNANNRQLQLKQNGDVILSNSGNVYVSNGTTQGRLYDSVINPPPSTNTNTNALNLMNCYNVDMNTQQLGSNTLLQWTSQSTTIGTVNLALSNNTTFTNNSSNQHLYLISGYMSFFVTEISETSLTLNVFKNSTTENSVYSQSTINNIPYPNIGFSFTIALNANEYFNITASTNSTTVVYANGVQTPNTSNLNIVQLF